MRQNFPVENSNFLLLFLQFPFKLQGEVPSSKLTLKLNNQPTNELIIGKMTPVVNNFHQLQNFN